MYGQPSCMPPEKSKCVGCIGPGFCRPWFWNTWFWTGFWYIWLCTGTPGGEPEGLNCAKLKVELPHFQTPTPCSKQEFKIDELNCPGDPRFKQTALPNFTWDQIPELKLSFPPTAQTKLCSKMKHATQTILHCSSMKLNWHPSKSQLSLH